MIRYDGIYISEPVETYDKRSKSEKSNFYFNAYFFFKDNTLRISSKHDFLENIKDFKKSDFAEEISTCKQYDQFEGFIKLKKEYSFEGDVEIEIKNSNELYVRFSQKTLFFVSWQEIESSKGVFLLEFFNRFDRDKLEKKHL